MICAFFLFSTKTCQKGAFQLSRKDNLIKQIERHPVFNQRRKAKKNVSSSPLFQFQNIFALLTLFTSIFAEIQLPSASRPERND